MTTPLSSRSSWIESIGYCRTKDGETWIAVFTKRGDAILYRGVPSTLPGLIAAGRVKTKNGERLSHGAAYNRFLRGKYESQTIEDPKEVELLKKFVFDKSL